MSMSHVHAGIVWKHGDPHTFLSSSKDCMLYQHLFRDATRPADAANPVGIDINPTGSILYASSDKLAPTSTGRWQHRLFCDIVDINCSNMCTI